MWKNYLTIIIRNIRNHKLYSLINVVGLAVGLTSCGLILLWIQHETKYDQHHLNGDRIYRVLRQVKNKTSGDSYFSNSTLGPLGPALKADFPEIEAMTRIFTRSSWFWYKDKGFRETLCIADSSFLDVFTFPLLKGDHQALLKHPFSVVITETTAQRYFGSEDPIGKIVTVEDRYTGGDYEIVGILKDLPRPSTLRHFDFLTFTVSSSPFMQTVWEVWRKSSFRPVKTYLLLSEGTSHADLERKLPDFTARYFDPETRANTTYHLQPFRQIYLYSRSDYGLTSGGSITYVYLFATIGALILLIACANFMNLATARSAKRAREVGIRKTVGAHKVQLINQFFGESLFISTLSLLFSIVIIELVLPTFEQFVGRDLNFGVSDLPILIILTVLMGLIAGSYPAFFLSSFQPVQILSGKHSNALKGVRIREILIVFQFCVSIVLIICTGVIYQQLNYIQNKKLGFNKDMVVMMPLFAADRSLTSKYELIKQEFLKHPNIHLATASQTQLGYGGGRELVIPEGFDGEEIRMRFLAADEDFLDTFEIDVIAGRNLDKNITSDSFEAFILNETAVKRLGWEDPVGKQFIWPLTGRRGTVIGIVRDFHLRPLHEEIEPIFICKWQEKWNLLSVKIGPENFSSTIDFMESKWKQFIPNRPFDSIFLNESLERSYRKEIEIFSVLKNFTLLAFFVACIGLFGLANFSAEQRIKEIGIRKVLGANLVDIFTLLSKEFLKLIAVAYVLAFPLAYYAGEQWLQNFAYRINQSIFVFIIGAVSGIIVTLLIVGYQAGKAWAEDPVKMLRQE